MTCKVVIRGETKLESLFVIAPGTYFVTHSSSDVIQKLYYDVDKCTALCIHVGSGTCNHYSGKLMVETVRLVHAEFERGRPCAS